MKSNYTKKIINDYVVLDLETTGLSAYNDHIIEVGLVKVRNNEIVDTYDQLINPGVSISSFITKLTGITNEMVESHQSFDFYEEDILNFIGDDIILGHNTNFDYKFINTHLSKPLDNQYMDTVQFSKKLYPELSHHRLSDMTEYLHLYQNTHRAVDDCIATYELYETCKKKMKDNNLTINNLWKSK